MRLLEALGTQKQAKKHPNIEGAFLTPDASFLDYLLTLPSPMGRHPEKPKQLINKSRILLPPPPETAKKNTSRSATTLSRVSLQLPTTPYVLWHVGVEDKGVTFSLCQSALLLFLMSMFVL